MRFVFRTLFFLICLGYAIASVYAIVHQKPTDDPSVEFERIGGMLFWYLVGFIPLIIVYAKKHPNRASFWWKCALFGWIQPALVYLLIVALRPNSGFNDPTRTVGSFGAESI
jgi:hypothetical protein